MKESRKYFLIATGLVVTGVIVWYFLSIVAYILIAAVISVIGHPVVDFLENIKTRFFRMPRALGAALTLFLFWALIFTFFSFFIPLVAEQAEEISSINTSELLEKFDEPLKTADNWFAKLKITQNQQITFHEYISEKIISFLSVSDLSVLFGKIAGLFGNFFVAFFAISFISFFFLKDDRLFGNMILGIVPTGQENQVKHALMIIKKLLRRYLIGICLDVSIIIMLITIGLSIVGLELEYVLLIALFAGILNIIPYIGPIIGIAFGLIMGVITHSGATFYMELVPMLGFMLIVFITVQVLDATVFQPLIYSNSVKAHPLEIFLVIMIAGSLAGIPGMIFAIPSYTILRVVAKEFFYQYKVVKKLTEKIE